MGVAITELLDAKPISFEQLKGKVIAIDAFNILYQFLSVLRGPDGAPLTNGSGKITSHLQGLLSRNIQFLNYGIKPIYVFDGTPPALKDSERRRRKEVKEAAKVQYEDAKDKNDVELMRKFAARMVSVDAEIISSAKKLLDLLGIPWVQAPSEGEAQAAHMVKKGDADFVVSEDADSLLFGAPFAIRNLTISGKKKTKGKVLPSITTPIVLSLQGTLKNLNISYEKLIALGILVGTDYCPGGIKGLGPKKALKRVQTFSTLQEIFADWNADVPWQDVFSVFASVPCTDDYSLSWSEPKRSEVISWLSEEYGFSKERLEQQIQIEKKSQKDLSAFFT